MAQIFGSVAAGAAWKAARQTRPDANALRLHIQRGIVVCFVGLLFFWGVGRLPLAEAIALSFVAPLVALFMAAIMLG